MSIVRSLKLPPAVHVVCVCRASEIAQAMIRSPSDTVVMETEGVVLVPVAVLDISTGDDVAMLLHSKMCPATLFGVEPRLAVTTPTLAAVLEKCAMLSFPVESLAVASVVQVCD